MKKHNRKKRFISRLLTLSLVMGSVLSMAPYEHTRAQSRDTESHLVLVDDEQTVSPSPIPTLTPAEVALKASVETAVEKTKQAPIIGCRRSIGTGETAYGKVTYLADIVQDHTAKVRHEAIDYIDEYGETVDRKEDWFDTASGRYYIYDDEKKRYTFGLDGEDHSILDYFSLEFYLEYISKVPAYSKGDPVDIDLPGGSKVTCDVIRHVHEARDYQIIENTNQTRLVRLVYYIGQEDGLIYRIEHGDEEAASTMDMYYPTDHLSIPAEYTQNPVLADGNVLRKNNFIYVTYSKGKKTYLTAYVFAKKKSKEIRLVSSIKLGKRTYTVNKVDERAFFGMNKLKKVILPKTITSIGKEAFGSCPNLKTLVVKNKTLRKKLKKSKKYIKKIMFEGDKII